MMDEQEYNQALQRTHIPSGQEWNLRYLTALEANGLKLVPLPERITGYYCQAPQPVPNQEPTWEPSLIVPYYCDPAYDWTFLDNVPANHPITRATESE